MRRITKRAVIACWLTILACLWLGQARAQGGILPPVYSAAALLDGNLLLEVAQADGTRRLQKTTPDGEALWTCLEELDRVLGVADNLPGGQIAALCAWRDAPAAVLLLDPHTGVVEGCVAPGGHARRMLPADDGFLFLDEWIDANDWASRAALRHVDWRGEPCWTFDLSELSYVRLTDAVCAGDGVLLAVSLARGSFVDDGLFMLDETGKLRWQRMGEALGFSANAVCAVNADGFMVVGACGGAGVIGCFDMDGNVRWLRHITHPEGLPVRFDRVAIVDSGVMVGGSVEVGAPGQPRTDFVLVWMDGQGELIACQQRKLPEHCVGLFPGILSADGRFYALSILEDVEGMRALLTEASLLESNAHPDSDWRFAQRYNQMSLSEIRVRLGAFEISFGETYDIIMNKAGREDVLFEKVGENPNFFYDVFDESTKKWAGIGLGFGSDTMLNYAMLGGLGTINDTISNAMTFGELTLELGDEHLETAIYGGKVITVSYLWKFENFYLEATSFPLELCEEEDLLIETIEIYAPERFPLHDYSAFVKLE